MTNEPDRFSVDRSPCRNGTFLIVKNRKEVNQTIEKFFAGLSSVIVFGLIIALLLGVIWVIVAIVHWAWRHS
jgi:hypothetical protein